MDSKVEMRKVLSDVLIEMAKKDDRICVVTSDSRQIGGMQQFSEEFPNRFFNVGIAEANMVGVAAGLAVSGRKPFAFAFSPFITRRCLDQIMVSGAYSHLNIVLCGLNPGVLSEINGGTHQAYDDIGAVRSIANLRIVEPVDRTQLKSLIPVIIEQDGPVYLRFDRSAAPDEVNPEDYQFVLGKADLLRDGSDLTIIANGLMIAPVLEAREILAAEGISARVVNMHTIKPADAECITACARETGAILTVENHNIIGGLGSAVAEVLSEQCPVYLTRVGIKDRFGEVGFKPYLMKALEIDTASIVRGAKDVLRKKNARNPG